MLVYFITKDGAYHNFQNDVNTDEMPRLYIFEICMLEL